VGNPEGRRPQSRYEPILEDDIKMDLRATEWGGVDRIVQA
jgi:hypothetical protein